MPTRIWRESVCMGRFLDGIFFRTQILKRIEDLTTENGNLKILLEEQCQQKEFDPAPYYCISEDPYVWTKPCFKVSIKSVCFKLFLEHMLKYNYTRYSAGRRIANIHFDAVRDVTLLTYDKVHLDFWQRHFLILGSQRRESDSSSQRQSTKYHAWSSGRNCRHWRFFDSIVQGSSLNNSGEKCEALEEVMGCILPFLSNKCGDKVQSMLQTIIEVG